LSQDRTRLHFAGLYLQVHLAGGKDKEAEAGESNVSLAFGTGTKPVQPDAFKRTGIVERTARGINTIYFEQLRNGRPVPSYERSDATGVALVLPGGQPHLGFVQPVVEEGKQDTCCAWTSSSC